MDVMMGINIKMAEIVKIRVSPWKVLDDSCLIMFDNIYRMMNPNVWQPFLPKVKVGKPGLNLDNSFIGNYNRY